MDCKRSLRNATCSAQLWSDGTLMEMIRFNREPGARADFTDGEAGAVDSGAADGQRSSGSEHGIRSMNAPSMRVQRLEEKRTSWQAEKRPNPADVLRERYRRRREERGEPYVPLPPAEYIPGQTIADVLRIRNAT